MQPTLNIELLIISFFVLFFTQSNLTFAVTVPRNYIKVPLVRQVTDYSCGAATMSAVLYYWKMFDGSETDLYKLLNTTPKDGTEPAKMVEVAKSYGLNAELRDGLTIKDLQNFLYEGKTVILDIQAWRLPENKDTPWSQLWNDGHYVIAIAIDRKNLYVMDPSTPVKYGYIPLLELYSRWHDFEDRHGPDVKNYQLGIIIFGTSSIQNESYLNAIRVE